MAINILGTNTAPGFTPLTCTTFCDAAGSFAAGSPDILTIAYDDLPPAARQLPHPHQPPPPPRFTGPPASEETGRTYGDTTEQLPTPVWGPLGQDCLGVLGWKDAVRFAASALLEAMSKMPVAGLEMSVGEGLVGVDVEVSIAGYSVTVIQ